MATLWMAEPFCSTTGSCTSLEEDPEDPFDDDDEED